MMQNMMHGGMMSGADGWFMMGAHAAVFVVVILAGAALVKYLFFSPRAGS